jgi:glucose/arabinose dehydrogenase
MKSEKIFFRLAQPWGNHNGGQILFDPNVLKSDAQKLFIMLGDGGQGGDPLNSGQNASTFLGSILRIDVDSAPDSNKLYSVPKDNPFYKSNLNILPEIWSYGLRNPWRCSFDRNNTFYFYCGDVGQNTREEISLITKGGNMGWNKWEGTYDYRPSEKSIPNDVKPILEYSHNINLKGHSICGGFVYRSDTADDLDLAGKYIFADYIGPLFVGSESAPGSGKFSYQRVSWGCSKNSPMKCPQATGTIYSMAQDYKGELYFLTDTGIYKLSSKGLCDPAQSSLNDPLPDDTELYVILPFAVCFIVVFTYFIHARYFSKAKSSNIEETSPKNPPK